jgi:hypothetical protein
MELDGILICGLAYPVTVAERPTPAGGHSELPADKRPVAACGKLSKSSDSTGSAQMTLNFLVALHDASVV